MVTGGGAKNRFLVDLLKKRFTGNLFSPEVKIIDFKEALVFGFLGVLRWTNEINTLASVTGASRDSSGGKIHKAVD